MSDRFNKILVLSLAGIGDTLLATPFLHELRLQFPQAEIDCFVLWAGSKGILQNNPHINQVHQLNLLKAGKPEILKFLAKLRSNRYDLSINTHPQSRVHYRALAAMIGARQRLSHSYECSTRLDRLLVPKLYPQDYSRHSVHQNFDLLQLLERKPNLTHPELEIFPSTTDQTNAADHFKKHQSPASIQLGFHVGSGGTKNLPLKRWPLPRYGELIERILKERPEIICHLFGGPEEEADHQHLIKKFNSPRVQIVRTKSILETAEALKHCHAFISVDTALMHLAAAVKVSRQIVIEAPTFNKTNEPYNQRYFLAQNPMLIGKNKLDFYRYDGRDIQGTREELLAIMNSITADQVFAVLDQALSSEPL